MANTMSLPSRRPIKKEPRPGLWPRMRRYGWGYLFVAPWILLYVAFGLYPLLLSFYLTFFEYSFIRPEEYTFVGIGNWLRGVSDPLFWQSILNILYNQAIFIGLTLGLGLLSALLLYQATRGGSFFRTIYFMPVVTSVVVLMAIGNYLVSPTGPIQEILVRIGLLQGPVFWKFSNWLPMPIIALINSWKWFGVSTVILLAGLQSIDRQFYEAAAIDGANGRQQFWRITLPQLRPQLFFLLVVNVINGLQMFTELFTIGYDVYGGPNHQALTPVLYLYAQAFDRSNMGYASALGLLLALLIALLTLLQFRLFPSEAREGE
ncbi:MAG: sugar ABC transporter permease [Caldilineaceae bacterium]|nr:sugar ABC transporter permease [Caldilineaceae bacterium]